MFSYFLKRLALIIPTLFGVLLLNFCLLKLMPGSPLDHLAAKVYGGTTRNAEVTNFNAGSESYAAILPDAYGRQMVNEGSDDPLWHQFAVMVRHYLVLDFGKSYFRDITVLELIKEKLPVSLSLGLGTLLISYLLAIALGIRKALYDNSFFDGWTSFVLAIFYAMPNFLIATFFIILFAGGLYWDFFPLKGLISEHWESLSLWSKIVDVLHHLTLPFLSIVLGGLAGFTFLVKGSFLDELKKPYITTVYAYGGSKAQAVRHATRHMILTLLAYFPQSFVRVFFMGNLVVEIIFSLDGLGLLIFQAALERDYPVVVGTLFVFTCMGLLVQLLVDLLYPVLDPRIHFKRQRP